MSEHLEKKATVNIARDKLKDMLGALRKLKGALDTDDDGALFSAATMINILHLYMFTKANEDADHFATEFLKAEYREKH